MAGGQQTGRSGVVQANTISGSQQIGKSDGHAPPAGQQVLPFGPQNLPDTPKSGQQRFEQHLFDPEHVAKVFLQRFFFFFRFFFASTAALLRWSSENPVAPSARR